MSETEHEHDTDDEAPEAPVSPETVIDEETAAEEAEEAETDAGEGGDGSDGEDEPGEQPGTQAQAKSERDQQKAVDKMFDAFQRNTDRHTKRVAEIAGDSATDLLQCPMCAPDAGQPNITGWLLPVPPSEAKIANVRQAIGLAPKIDYREDPHSRVCPTCGGLKSVVPQGGATGGLTLSCADCNSQGWIATDAVRGGVQPNGDDPHNVTWTAPEAPQLDPDDPEVAALKARGYTVIAPYAPPVA